MSFHKLQPKGLENFFVDAGLPADKLRIHISELAPGARPHPPHQHAGIEALYVFAGAGTFEIEDERQPIGPNEAIVFDPGRLHGLVNSGAEPMRYLVIIGKDVD